SRRKASSGRVIHGFRSSVKTDHTPPCFMLRRIMLRSVRNSREGQTPMSQSNETAAGTAPGEKPPVEVKKYANRRPYNTESSSYITLDSLADMVRNGRDFVVYDAKTGEDITRSVLTQIIVEEEGKGRALLPTGFLRQLIGFYGDSMQNLVPKY